MHALKKLKEEKNYGGTQPMYQPYDSLYTSH